VGRSLYIVPSALSGTGKSEAFRHATEPFIELEHGMIDQWERSDLPTLLADQEVLEIEIAALKKKISSIAGGLKNGGTADQAILKEGLVEKLAVRADVEKLLRAPILTVEDVTIEELAVLLSYRDETLASLSPDAGAVINNLLGRYSNLGRTDENIYLKGYSGDRCKVNRRSRPPIRLKSPCIALLWLVQPDKLDTLLSEKTLTEGGWVPRLLACHSHAEPQPIVEDRPCIAPAIRDAYHHVVKNLTAAYRLGGQAYTVTPTREAEITLRAHYNAIVARRRGELRDVTIYAARWNEQAWRISVCFHAGLHGSKAHVEPISAASANHAIELADWFSLQQLEILKASRVDRRLRRAQSLLSRVLDYGGQQTLNELKRRNGFSHDECRSLAVEFPGLLHCKMIPPTVNGGRPSEVLFAVRNSVKK
jgi:replicative DNA helicase